MGTINQNFYDTLYYKYKTPEELVYHPLSMTVNKLPDFNEQKEKFIKKIKKVEENNMEEIDNILERYERYQEANIDFECDKNLEFIRNSSDENKIAEKLQIQAIKELKKIYPEKEENNLKHLIYISIADSENTQKEINKLIDTRAEQLNKLKSKIKDVKAMIAIADLFDEKMQVLKSYDIIDEEGRINEC